MYRVLVLPGSAGPTGSEEYKQIYATISDEAMRRGLECKVTFYPGHEGLSSGLLTYASALSKALGECREYRPDWIIARSFGCVVAVGLLGSEEGWVLRCQGLVLWSSVLGSSINRIWSTEEKRRETISGHREYDSYLAPDFFESIPAVEDLIRTARCNIRLARGTRDTSNTEEDIALLAETHRHTQPDFLTEVVAIEGVAHGVSKCSMPNNLLADYLSCLFDPITG